MSRNVQQMHADASEMLSPAPEKTRTPSRMMLPVPPEIASTIKATASAAGITIDSLQGKVAELVFSRLTTEEVVALGAAEVEKRLDRLRGVGRPAGAEG